VERLSETGVKCKDKYARGMAAAREFDQKISHKNMGIEKAKADKICPYCKRPLEEPQKDEYEE